MNGFDHDIDPDEDHASKLVETGYWGASAAGAIIQARDTGRIMLAFRSLYVLEPHTWGTFGGAVDAGENEIEAVIRECKEELGFTASRDDAIPLLRFQDGAFSYQNYVIFVDHEFEPDDLNWEVESVAWFELQSLPDNQHFGLRTLLSDSGSMEIMEATAWRNVHPKF